MSTIQLAPIPGIEGIDAVNMVLSMMHDERVIVLINNQYVSSTDITNNLIVDGEMGLPTLCSRDGIAAIAQMVSSDSPSLFQYEWPINAPQSKLEHVFQLYRTTCRAAKAFRFAVVSCPEKYADDAKNFTKTLVLRAKLYEHDNTWVPTLEVVDNWSDAISTDAVLQRFGSFYPPFVEQYSRWENSPCRGQLVLIRGDEYPETLHRATTWVNYHTDYGGVLSTTHVPLDSLIRSDYTAGDTDAVIVTNDMGRAYSREDMRTLRNRAVRENTIIVVPAHFMESASLDTEADIVINLKLDSGKCQYHYFKFRGVKAQQ